MLACCPFLFLLMRRFLCTWILTHNIPNTWIISIVFPILVWNHFLACIQLSPRNHNLNWITQIRFKPSLWVFLFLARESLGEYFHTKDLYLFLLLNMICHGDWLSPFLIVQVNSLDRQILWLLTGRYFDVCLDENGPLILKKWIMWEVPI